MPLVMLLLWTRVAREAPVGRFGEARFVAYFLAMLIARLLTGSWIVWLLNHEIKEGAIGMRLLRPVHPLASYAVDGLSAVPFKTLFVTPVAVVAVVAAGPGSFSHDPVCWALVPLALVGAWAINFVINAAIGSLGFYWDSSLSLFDAWLALSWVFSGYLVPIELFPAPLDAIARALPFRYSLSLPVEAALGLLDRRALARALVVQWGYVALLGLFAARLWRGGVRRFAAFGG
jgi:ABC-2 type transport system permease protein